MIYICEDRYPQIQSLIQLLLNNYEIGQLEFFNTSPIASLNQVFF
jgi:hypothetical protein